MSPVRRVKTKIGELLLQKGLITQIQLEHALSLQHSKEKEEHLGQILIELGYVSREDLYTILAIQSGYPYISIGHCAIRPEVISLIPEAMAKKYHVLPVDKIQGVLTVAMVNPLDIVALDQIKKVANSEVKVFLTTPPELSDMIVKYYGQKQE
ncbi:MAG: hypothetical protein FJZ13_05730 [Candidatus Omnitrophica bacterium]|nr:hypothetical protein [Candidatus Omnitrophota bacterium]